MPLVCAPQVHTFQILNVLKATKNCPTLTRSLQTRYTHTVLSKFRRGIFGTICSLFTMKSKMHFSHFVFFSLFVL